MMTGSSQRASPMSQMAPGRPAISLQTGSRLWLSNCTVEGQTAAPGTLSPGVGVTLCGDVALYLGGGTHVVGGLSSSGVRADPIVTSLCVQCHPYVTPHLVYRDPSVTLTGLFLPHLEHYTYIPGPVAALEAAASPTQLSVVQHSAPSSALLLAAGGARSTKAPEVPAPYWLGLSPVLLIDFGVAGPMGGRTLTWPVPPTGVPSGTRFELQALELLGTGELLSSNVISVGVW